MRHLAVPEPVLAAIRRECEAGYPLEACGFLLGRLDGGDGTARIRTTRPAVNKRAGEARRRRYLIEPDTYLATEREAEAEGLDVLGFWHSHPDAPARPSAYDLDHAWPSVVYLIVAVKGGRAGEAAAWRLSDDRSGFAPVDLEIRDFVEPS